MTCFHFIFQDKQNCRRNNWQCIFDMRFKSQWFGLSSIALHTHIAHSPQTKLTDRLGKCHSRVNEFPVKLFSQNSLFTPKPKTLKCILWQLQFHALSHFLRFMFSIGSTRKHACPSWMFRFAFRKSFTVSMLMTSKDIVVYVFGVWIP